MRFHRLKLKNLNSLYGEHTIDFDEELGSAPLFLIRGPTGSGKTTILDAISLALFGTTPRLNEVGNIRERCAKILSKGEGRAEVELLFSLQDDGARRFYRAVWEFWRSHDSPTGTPQNPRRSLFEVNNQGEQIREVVNSRTQSAYDAAFEEALKGLKVDDFYRSVMLAQHQFAAFLKASDEEKASILESLTKTDHYQKIGEMASRRYGTKKDERDTKKSEIKGMEESIPDDEEMAEFEEALEAQTTAVKAREAVYKKEKKGLDWLLKEEELEGELEEASQEVEEATAKKKEASEDFERLESADAVEPGREPLQALKKEESELEELQKKVEELEKARDAAQGAVKKKAEAVEEAKDKKKAAEQAKKEAAPTIQEGRRLQTELQGAKKAQAEEKEAVAKREKSKDELQQRLKEAKAALDDAKTKAEDAAEALAEEAHLEGLDQAYSGLKAEVKAAIKEAGDLEALDKRCRKQATALKAAAEKLEKKEARLEKEEASIEPLKTAEKKAASALDKVVGEATSVRERRQVLNEDKKERQTRKASLEEGKRLVAQRDQHLKVAKEKADEASEWADKIEEKDPELEALSESLEDKKEELQELELSARVQEFRLHLEAHDDEECPVCGSLEHPLLEGQSAAELRADEEERQEALSKEVARLQERHKTLSADLVSWKTKKEGVEAEAEDRRQKAQGLSDEIDGALEGLEVEAEEEALSAAIEEEEQAIEELDESLETLDERAEAHEKAEEALDEAREAIQSLKEEVDGLGLKIKMAQEKLEEDRGRRDDERQVLEGGLDKLKDRFEEIEIALEVQWPEDGPIDGAAIGQALEAALEEADEARERYQKLEDKKEKWDKTRSELDTKVAGLGEKLETAQTEYDAAKEKWEKAQDKVKSLQEDLEDLLDGKDLDEWEKSLDKNLRKAAETLETRQKELGESEKKLATAKSAVASNDEAIEKRKKAVEAKSTTLDNVLEELPVDDRQALEEALMEVEALQKLRQTCEAIDKALNSAQARKDGVSKKLKNHREDRPEDLDEEVQKEAQEEVVEALQEELDELKDERSKLEERLESGRKKREQLSEQRQELEELEEAIKPWRRLHNAIGVADGKHFKIFAQSLNLKEIIDRANRHLKKLYDRYRLAIQKEDGFPTLQFEVIDKNRAERRRTLDTLSGGETFLVSLALSLGLADNRRLDLPIETIFLDEGFGTLDRDSLERAMGCLKELHQREGRTVGVISHVEALHREGGIEHQVVLDKINDAASKIRVKVP